MSSVTLRQVKQWFKMGTPSDFGDTQAMATVVDEQVRQAREISAEEFVVSRYVIELVQKLWRRVLVPEGPRGAVKINIYGREYLLENLTGLSIQTEILPLPADLTAGELQNWTGVTFNAAVAVRPYPLATTVVMQATETVDPVSGVCLQLYLDGLHVSVAGALSQLPYGFIGGSAFWIAPDTLLLITSTGYEITVQSYCGQFGSTRISSINLAVPEFAFGHTAGLVGSWDGNATNDLVGADGVDWLAVYSDDLTQAQYSFGQSWRVNSNQSLFTVAQSLFYETASSRSRRRLLQTGGGSGGGGGGSINLGDLFESLVVNATAPPAIAVPAVWPNATLQLLANQTCASAAGTNDTATGIYQACLLDVFTSGELMVASGIAQTTAASQVFLVPATTVALLGTALSTGFLLTVNLSGLAQQPACAGGFVANLSLAASLSLAHACAPLNSLAPASQPTALVPLPLPFSFLAAQSFQLNVSSLMSGGSYLVQSAALIPDLWPRPVCRACSPSRPRAALRDARCWWETRSPATRTDAEDPVARATARRSATSPRDRERQGERTADHSRARRPLSCPPRAAAAAPAAAAVPPPCPAGHLLPPLR